MRETINRENGAITLFVLLACLFFVFTLAGVYISNLNKLQTQEQQVRQIQENYSKDIGRIDEIYENLSKGIKVNLSQNPSNEIWTKDEVTLTGNAEVKGESSATIDGYTFTTNAEEPSSWKKVNNQVKITETIKITENGEYYFWVKDSKNEISSTKITVANIDKTAPTVGTIIAREESQDGTEYDLTKSLWTNKDVYIEKVDGSDKEAGHKETTITIQKDGRTVEKWTNIEEPVILTETGTYTIIVTTEDNAGNTVTSEPYIIKMDKEAPIVTATATTESITITATDEGSGIIGYAVTDLSTQPVKFTAVANTKSLSTKVSNLTQDTLYYVWVIDEAKNINAEKTINTGTVVALTDSNTMFSSTPSGWTNENVTVTASTTVTGYTIQTSRDAINWDTTNPVIFTENGAMYARLWDGTNAGGYASYNVTNIDKEAPTIVASILGNSITITATDEGSGIVGYQIEDSPETPTAFVSVNNTSKLSVQKDNTNLNTTYYAWTKDLAGNVSEVTEIKSLSIGDYIDYTPDADATYVLSKSISGDADDQEIAQDTEMKWRILNIYDDCSLDLVGIPSNSSESIDLKDSQLCNNGTYILNDICEKLYSSGNNIKARSLNLADLDKHLTTEGINNRNSYINTETNIKYRETKTYERASYRYYPWIYQYEKDSGVSSTTTKTIGLTPEESYYGGFTNGFTTSYAYQQANEPGLTVTQTYYKLDMNESNYGEINSIFSEVPAVGIWLASRCVDTRKDYAVFGLYNLYSSGLGFAWGMASNRPMNWSIIAGFAYASPVVSIKLGTKTQISPCVGANTETNQHHLQIYRDALEVGDYVNYIPDTANDYTLSSEYSGYTKDQTISQNKSEKWQILNLNEDGSVDLIGNSTGLLYLQGSLAYNNGVYLLNDICEKLYSRGEIKARSVNSADIEKNLTEEGKKVREEYVYSNTKYGNKQKYTGDNSYYPFLYASENGAGINSDTVVKNGIGENENAPNNIQIPTKENYSQANTGGLTATQTNYTIEVNKENLGEVSYLLETGMLNYWIASRKVDCGSNYASFGLWNGSQSSNATCSKKITKLRNIGSFTSNGTESSMYNLGGIRPVITLKSYNQIVPCTGKNDVDNMHEINW